MGASRSSNQLVFYDTSLRYLGAASMPPVDGTGRLVLNIDRKSQRMWLHADGSTVVTSVGYDTTGALTYSRVALQTTGRPTGLFVDDHGLLFTSETGILREYTLTGASSRRSPLAGMTAGGIFVLPQTFSNYDGRVHGPRNTDVEDWDAAMP